MPHGKKNAEKPKNKRIKLKLNIVFDLNSNSLTLLCNFNCFRSFESLKVGQIRENREILSTYSDGIFSNFKLLFGIFWLLTPQINFAADI